MNFVVVRSLYPYNGIIGRPGVRKIQAVPSTAHGMLKFPVPGWILTLRSSRIIPLKCTMVFGPEARPSDIIQATEERIKVAIHPEHPEQTIIIGSTLTEEGRKALCDLLRCSLDVFSWKLADMTGVPRHIAEHRLNPRPTRSRDKLHVNGKVGASFSTCKQTAKKILPGSYNHCHHGLAIQADSVKTKGRRKAAQMEYRARFDAANNEAEYETLIAGLRIAEQMGVKNLQEKCGLLFSRNQVLVEELKEKSINEAKVLAVVEEEGDTCVEP
ncbi:hypothetical protein Tco_0388944 [Tanacetum coccineum]